MAPFSLAMINESSGSIISDRWKLHGLLQQEEWFRVATLPYFRMFLSLKFRRSEFEGGYGERSEISFDMEQFSIVGYTIFEQFRPDMDISVLRGFHLYSSLWPADSSAPWSSDCLGSTLLPVALSVCIEVGLTSFSSSCRIIPPSLCNLWKKIATLFI